MTDTHPNNDDWIENPAPPPRAVGGPAHQPPRRLNVVGVKPRGPAKPELARLARELEEAPVAAWPEGQAAEGDPGPSPDREEDAPGSPPGGAPPRTPPRGSRPTGEIWEGCPVKPLGVNGAASYYLDMHGQLRRVEKHEGQTLLHLFGHRNAALCRAFPQFKQDGEIKPHRFDKETAAMTMIAACSEKGLFDPEGSVRGPGAWTDDAGAIVYHAGTHILTAEGRQEPGQIGGRIYPAYPAINEPARVAAGDPAPEILGALGTWNWTRRDVDPMLALGMIGVMALCGALAWRPVFWLTGDKASGKSAFQDFMRYVIGDRAIVQSADATKSGITSALGHSSLPVAIDELEPGHEGSSKERDLIVLARIAASGSQWRRGSADQKGIGGNVYSSFLFSSILIPGVLSAQDRSRLIILGLNPIPEGQARPVITARAWGPKGAALKRVLIDRWASWPERLDLWRASLADAGIAGRNGDNWATVMAMADMALNPELPALEARQTWARKLAYAAKSDIDEIGTNAEDMLMHLLGQPFDVYRRGELWNLAHWVMVAGCLPAAPRELLHAPGADTTATVTEWERREAAKRANEKLAKVGLRVRGEADEAELFIPHAPLPGLAKLFLGSPWASGVWAQAARRVPNATPVEQPLTLAGQRSRGVYIPFRSIAGLQNFPMDRAPADTRTPGPDITEDFA